MSGTLPGLSFIVKKPRAIYVGRRLAPALAKQVADLLMAHDAIGAHARDELGISESLRVDPAHGTSTAAPSNRPARRSARAWLA